MLKKLLVFGFVLMMAACGNMPSAEKVPTVTAEEVVPEEAMIERPAVEEPLEEPAVEASAMPEAYAAVMAQYKQAVDEKWDRETLNNAGLNFMVHDLDTSNHEALGYALLDLDSDGTDELILAPISVNPFFEKMIFELYTLDGAGAAVRVFTAGERDRYYGAKDGLFANVGSNSAFDSIDTTLRYEGGSMVDLGTVTAPSDYEMPKLTAIE